MKLLLMLSAAFTLALGVSLGGCAETKPMVPVTVIPTRTPGVAFVIVRPEVSGAHGRRTQPGDGKPIAPSSQYLLLCDARPAEGMNCSIPTESAVARYSYAPRTGPAAAPLDDGIGTLAGSSAVVVKSGSSEITVAPATTPAPGAGAPGAPAAAAGTPVQGGQP